jgi:hypothetical protein
VATLSAGFPSAGQGRDQGRVHCHLLAFFSCKICIKVFGTRALNILQENERFIGKVSVQDVCMVSWQFIFNFLIGGFRTNPV